MVFVYNDDWYSDEYILLMVDKDLLRFLYYYLQYTKQ